MRWMIIMPVPKCRSCTWLQSNNTLVLMYIVTVSGTLEMAPIELPLCHPPPPAADESYVRLPVAVCIYHFGDYVAAAFASLPCRLNASIALER